MTIASPCISHCQIDADTRLCKGCWRTIDEIIAWGSNHDDIKRSVWLLIEQRKIQQREIESIKTP
jgi:uncharacterized protein